jgi:hypothetical protein
MDAQGGSVVWRRGGIDIWLYKVITLIFPENGSVKDGGSDFSSECSGVRSGFAGQI